MMAGGAELPELEDTAPSIDGSGAAVAIIAPKKLVTIIAPMKLAVLELSCKDTNSKPFYLRTREGMIPAR
jgi:hypothetical protein